MADFEIRIVFHGLIGLVPMADARFLLPLPDLEGGFEHGRLPARIPPHLPCVTVPSKYRLPPPEIEPACRTADWVLDYELLGEEKRQMFQFDRERLTVSFSGSGSGARGFPSDLDPQLHASPSVAGAPSATDLAWVPSLKHTGITGADQFNAALVTADFVPVIDEGFNRLVGTVLLDSGELSTTGVVEAANGQDAVFDFFPASDPNTTRFSQAMFRRMVWTAPATGEGVELVFTEGDGEFQTRRCLPLRPRDGRIELDVYNRELEDILGLGFGMESADGITDPDFAVSYWMSHAWGMLGAGAAVIPRSPPLGHGGSGEACKVARFEGI